LSYYVALLLKVDVVQSISHGVANTPRENVVQSISHGVANTPKVDVVQFMSRCAVKQGVAVPLQNHFVVLKEGAVHLTGHFYVVLMLREAVVRMKNQSVVLMLKEAAVHFSYQTVVLLIRAFHFKGVVPHLRNVVNMLKSFHFLAAVPQVGNVVDTPKGAAVRKALHAASLLTVGVVHQIASVVRTNDAVVYLGIQGVLTEYTAARRKNLTYAVIHPMTMSVVLSI
jgi:hypothetical protein